MAKISIISKQNAMNEEKIKELFAVNYISLIAEYAGFYVTTPGQDYGTDLHIEEMLNLSTGAFIPSGKIISLQIKCTSEENITKTTTHLKYDLPVRNYNLLIQRQYYTNNYRRYSPYILMVVLVPKNKMEWITQTQEGNLNLKVKAFWYLPNPEKLISSNKSSKRIEIPLENLVNLEIYPKLFNLLWSKNQKS